MVSMGICFEVSLVSWQELMCWGWSGRPVLVVQTDHSCLSNVIKWHFFSGNYFFDITIITGSFIIFYFFIFIFYYNYYYLRTFVTLWRNNWNNIELGHGRQQRCSSFEEIFYGKQQFLHCISCQLKFYVPCLKSSEVE